MATTIPDVLSQDSVKMANKTFYNNGRNVFITADGNGYFVMADKSGLIVTPDGVYWTCYYWDKERIKELSAIPDYSGEDENGYESLGAGVFSKAMSVWGPQTVYTDAIIIASANGGSVHLHAGDKFLVDCSILK